MKRIIEIPEYNPKRGIILNWTSDFEITVDTDGNQVHISGNSAGLESLANHLLNLAQDNVPEGTHIHLDDYNSLEDNSAELIIERI